MKKYYNDTMQTEMELMLNANKLKYETLQSVLKTIKIRNNVNIYIDVNSLFDILFRKHNLEKFHTISPEDSLTISSQIVNTIAHYRHYFYSRLQRPTVFYLVYTDIVSLYFKSLDSNYKTDLFKLRLDQTNIISMNLQNNIKKNINLVRKIVQYIPDAFFIYTGNNEVGSTMQYLIESDPVKDSTNLIITNDKVHYQLVCNENTFILDNKAEKSSIINAGNVFNKLCKKEITNIDSSLYKVMLSISGYDKYSVSGMKGVKYLKAINIITKAIIKDLIISDSEYNSITGLTQKLLENNLIDSEGKEIIDRNFKLFNYKLHVNTFTDSYLDNIDSQLINKTDYDQVMLLSNQYYEKQPLMFLELMETFHK